MDFRVRGEDAKWMRKHKCLAPVNAALRSTLGRRRRWRRIRVISRAKYARARVSRFASGNDFRCKFQSIASMFESLEPWVLSGIVLGFANTLPLMTRYSGLCCALECSGNVLRFQRYWIFIWHLLIEGRIFWRTPFENGRMDRRFSLMKLLLALLNIRIMRSIV